MDTEQLIAAIYAGAAIARDELVKELTKEAWRGLKSAVTGAFGPVCGRAIDKIEASPGDESSRLEIAEVIRSVSPQDAADIAPCLAALLKALQADSAAKSAVEGVARVKLEVEVGGNVILERLDGADVIDVKVKAAGDFAMRDVTMARGADPGN